MSEFFPEGYLIDTIDNKIALSSYNNLMDAYNNEKILEARATVCDGQHNLLVDLGCMKGVINREEGAIGIKEGTVRDIAIISKVNRPVCFVIEDFKKDENDKIYAVLSRRKAQEICIEQFVKKCIPGDIINAKITHLEPFGAFADIGCGIASMIPIDAISISRIEHPKERFFVGMEVKAIVKSIENNRITLSHKELLGTWEENAKFFSIGETVAGIVRSVENYGAFIELAPNLAGLAEIKDGVMPGQQASVYIKNIIPSRMKIKLIIIDTFDHEYKPNVPNYFYNGNHMDYFLYSPKDCEKIVCSTFNETKKLTTI